MELSSAIQLLNGLKYFLAQNISNDYSILQ